MSACGLQERRYNSQTTISSHCKEKRVDIIVSCCAKHHSTPWISRALSTVGSCIVGSYDQQSMLPLPAAGVWLHGAQLLKECQSFTFLPIFECTQQLFREHIFRDHPPCGASARCVPRLHECSSPLEFAPPHTTINEGPKSFGIWATMAHERLENAFYTVKVTMSDALLEQ